MTARAVEQMVCADLGVDCGSIEHWASTSVMEAMKIDRLILDFDWFKAGVESRMKKAMTRAAADAVLALGRQR